MSRDCFRRSRLALATLAVFGGIGLAGCGGSSDSSEGGSNPPPSNSSLTLSGTAATGLAIAAQPVEAKCASGTGSAVTNADGTYTITVTDGTLPCTLRVTTAGGEVLHSLALGTGSTARANITPVSQLIVARLAGGDPAGFFNAFDGSTVTAVSQENVQAAAAAIVATLQSAGIDLSSFGDLLTAELVAATEGGATGNAFDSALDALQATLQSSGTTLAELTQTVASSSPTAPRSGVAALPPELLLKPAAQGCSALRSGTYRVVMPSAPAGLQTQTLTLDATTMTATTAEGATFTWGPTAVEDCKYVFDIDGETHEAKVSAGGVILMTAGVSGGPFTPIVLFPEQTIPVSELAGTWQTLEWIRDSDVAPLSLLSADITLDASGTATAMTDCGGPALAECTAESVDGGLVANPEGGFDGSGADLSDARAFAYKSGSGDIMLMFVDPDGGFAFATRKTVRAMPSVGQKNGGWSTIIGPAGTIFGSGALAKAIHTVTEIDSPVPGSYVRVTDGTTLSQVLTINAPREGYLYRAPGSSSEIVTLGLSGTGLSVFGKLNDPNPSAFYGLNVDVQ